MRSFCRVCWARKPPVFVRENQRIQRALQTAGAHAIGIQPACGHPLPPPPPAPRSLTRAEAKARCGGIATPAAAPEESRWPGERPQQVDVGVGPRLPPGGRHQVQVGAAGCGGHGRGLRRFTWPEPPGFGNDSHDSMLCTRFHMTLSCRCGFTVPYEFLSDTLNPPMQLRRDRCS